MARARRVFRIKSGEYAGKILVKVGSHRARDRLRQALGREIKPGVCSIFEDTGYGVYEVDEHELETARVVKGVTQFRPKHPDKLQPCWSGLGPNPGDVAWCIQTGERSTCYTDYRTAVFQAVEDAIETQTPSEIQEWWDEDNHLWTVTVEAKYELAHPVENPPPARLSFGDEQAFGVYDPVTGDEEFFEDMAVAMGRAAFLSGVNGGIEAQWRMYTGDGSGDWEWGPMFGVRMHQVQAANPVTGVRLKRTIDHATEPNLRWIDLEVDIGDRYFVKGVQRLSDGTISIFDLHKAGAARRTSLRSSSKIANEVRDAVREYMATQPSLEQRSNPSVRALKRRLLREDSP